MAQHQLLVAVCILVVIYATSSVEGVCRKKSCVRYCTNVLGRPRSECLRACSRQAKACKVCVGPFKCLRCNSGYVRIGFQCYPCPRGCSCVEPNKCLSCLPGYTMTTDGVCAACPLGCICDPSTAECTDCDSGYIRNALSTGPKCLACSAGCASCTTAGPGYCNTCKTGFVKVGLFCQVCAPNCQSCATAGANSCDTCKTGYKLVTGASSSTCAACPANCASCDIAGPIYCDKCNDHYGLTLDHKNCQACAPNCLSCNTNGYNQCDPAQCVTVANYNAANKVCCATPPCIVANCVTGTATTCALCAPGYTKFTGSPDTCSVCSVANCYSCSTSATVCGKCLNGYAPAGGGASCGAVSGVTIAYCNVASGSPATCTECYTGYTPSASGSSCVACSVAHCDICAAQATCDSCAFGYTLANNLCTASCDPNCATSTCTKQGLGKCDSYCNAGFVLASDHTCQPCDTGCNTCVIEGPGKCDGPRCETGYTLTGNKCTKT